MRCIRFAAAVVAACTSVLLCLVTSPSALAVSAPGWELVTHSYPAHLARGQKAVIADTVYNVGGAESVAGAILTDTLPVGVEAVSGEGWTCDGGSPISCSREVEPLISTERAEYQLEAMVGAGVAEGELVNRVSVSGGGAAGAARLSEGFSVSSQPAGFGFSDIHAWASNANGTLDTVAGSHPFAFTFTYDTNANGEGELEGEMRNINVNVPPGLVGNATALPRCHRAEFDEEGHCPTGSQIGVALISFGGYLPPTALRLPIYNLVPPPGHPAEFAFEIFNNQVFLDAAVRSDGDYGITEHVPNTPQREVQAVGITIWGSPANPGHDAQRTCWEGGFTVNECSDPEAEAPLLTLPTSCKGPEEYSAVATEWLDSTHTTEIKALSASQEGTPVGLTGCEALRFEPSISVAPDTSDADTPAGLTVELKVPQEGLTTANGVATSNIKDTTVALPEGVVINPGQATGLAACQEAESAVGTQNAPSCPLASKVGTDEIETPLLKGSLKGNVYVLQSNPPNLKLLVAASGEGVNLKLVGDVHLNETTGQLVTTFENTPELPFTTFRLAFSGGAQAALATPATCGTYTTTSDFTPWSAPFVGDVYPSSDFLITHGPGTSACASALPFTPQLTAGATTDQAGGYTSFSLLLTREDGQQRIGTLQFKTPEGLLGMISRVPLCPEAQANAGTCSAASQIGHTVVEAGPGPYPLVVPEPGQTPAPIYLTEGYKGAPYGLSIVVPLHVGPFTLQTQIVRAKIAVDPVTAQLTITTDALPSIIDGIPADLRAIDAVIDRPEFMFNPTSCAPQSFSGVATSTTGTAAAISSHFQMGSCRSLTFKPNFKVSTSGKTSRANGASLDAKILYPTGKLEANQASSQANISYVKVELPKQLPSRLTTLQKACLAKVFEANPAKCPKESLVGYATAITPVIPVALTGPAYFVSHGGEAFPSLIVVLQGYGVTVDLVGSTFISKTGITSSTFKQVPDVPVTSFELKLPEGPYSALAANGNLCQQKLTMPTQFTAQNGATLNQKTPIGVEGCSTALKVIAKKLHGRTLTLGVLVPAAGHLKASGKGLSGASKTSHGREQLKLTLRVRRNGKFTSQIRLAYTPSTGKDRKKLIKSVTVTIRQA
jgi:hypothetical protein